MEHKDDDEREERLHVFLRPVIKSAPICGGYILDAMDWGSMMVVSEPGQNYDGVRSIILSGGIPATLSGGLKPTHVCICILSITITITHFVSAPPHPIPQVCRQDQA